MKKHTKKLVVGRETVRVLQAVALHGVVAGVHQTGQAGDYAYSCYASCTTNATAGVHKVE